MGQEKQYLSKSSFVTAVKKNSDSREIRDGKRSAENEIKSRATGVPVLCIANGVLVDSWSIAEYAGFSPVPADLKSILDEKLGPLSRQLAYHYLLKDNNRRIWNELCTANRHWLWRLLWWLFVGSYLTKLMVKIFKPNDLEAVSACREELKVVVASLDVILAARPGKYMTGDTPGAEDLALAALAAPLVMPSQYCLGKYTPIFADLARVDSDFQREVDFWRGTEVGRYCLSMYETHRIQSKI